MKRSRHSKIAGDFGEMLVLYYLSRYGFECARIDHTGIDLLARSADESRPRGITCQPIVRVVEFPISGHHSPRSLGGVTRHENIHKRARFCDLSPVFSDSGVRSFGFVSSFDIRHSSFFTLL